MKNDDLPDKPLSDDPEENLRMENELLRLKLKAELGAESHHISNIDPGIENEFLKNVLAFEQNFSNAKEASVYDLVGKPSFKKADELTDAQVEAALAEIIDLLTANNIKVYFGDADEYNGRTKYLFITEELFDHETTFMPIPGMTTCFDYEEFHPNHKKDIENRAMEFLSEWFKKSLNEKSWELANEFILPDRQILSKATVAAQLSRVFDSYTAFKNEKYKIIDIGYQLNDDTGIGHAEGGVRYDGVLENGEIVTFGGPFKLYMTYEGGWWCIFHIVFPGFEYF
ncbi:hypothetical protein [Mucilaginibacter sp.]|uniref:hypothetical protein n=1 Tax=Mucilaginibacter sp. TaxID=1882438 RepID=UPI00284DFB85|nr:hypothetical protein [Mucilaginibacter sp.]MDR3694171.1 hypothetical protein [Mucilaginibacter sp.]